MLSLKYIFSKYGVWSLLTIFFVWGLYMVSRLWMWFEYGMAGFGYDVGIYRHIIPAYFSDPGIVPFGFSAYSNCLLTLGASVDSILFNWYMFIAILIFFAVFAVVSRYFNRNVASVAVIIYSISIVQYEFFWWYYYRQFLALFFTLVAFLLVRRKSYFVIPVLVAMGIIHPLSLIPLGISLFIYMFFVERDVRTYLCIAGVISVVLLVFASGNELWIYIKDFLQYHGRAENFVAAGYQEFTGQFLTFMEFLKYSWWYALPGVVMFMFSYKKQKLLSIFFGVHIILIAVRMVLYHRFFVGLDVGLIMFGASSFSWLWQRVCYGRMIRSGIIVYTLCAAGFGIYHIIQKEPLIYGIEFDAIQDIPNVVIDSEYIVSINSQYAPWLYGYSDKKVIAPGIFEENKWDRSTWNMFWYGPDIVKKIELLKTTYGISPLYIYTGRTGFNLGPYSTYVTPFIIKVVL